MSEPKKETWDAYWKSLETQELLCARGYSQLVEFITSLMRVSDKKVLEVGAGTGRDCLLLSELEASVTLVDFSLKALNIAQEIMMRSLPENSAVALISANASSLPFKDETFDLVFHQGLLEHFRNPSMLLAEQFRILVPGGIIVVDVPQKYHIYTVYKHTLILLGKWLPGWETEYSVRELKGILEAACFKVIASKGYGIDTYLPTRVPSMVFRVIRYAHLFGKGRFGKPVMPQRIQEFWGNFWKRIEQSELTKYLSIAIAVAARKPL